VAIAAILAVGVAVALVFGYPRPGPLHQPPSEVATVEFSLTAEQIGTWGMPLPRNPTDSDIVLRSIEPISHEGLVIIGAVMTVPGEGPPTGASYYEFPPAGYATFPVEGAVIRPGGGVRVVFGVRLADGRDTGRVEGLRVRYAVGGRVSGDVLPYNLEITLADP
jgi:hypothetical protein